MSYVCMLCLQKGTGKYCTGVKEGSTNGCKLWKSIDLSEKMPNNDFLSKNYDPTLLPEGTSFDFTSSSELVLVNTI